MAGRAPVSPNPFRGRMSRAAILAAGATLMVTGAACDSDPPKNGDAGGDATSMSDTGGTLDTGSAGDTSGADGGNTTDSAANDRGIVALYGVVAPAPEYGAPPVSEKTPGNS